MDMENLGWLVAQWLSIGDLPKVFHLLGIPERRISKPFQSTKSIKRKRTKKRRNELSRFILISSKRWQNSSSKQLLRESIMLVSVNILECTKLSYALYLGSRAPLEHNFFAFHAKCLDQICFSKEKDSIIAEENERSSSSAHIADVLQILKYKS